MPLWQSVVVVVAAVPAWIILRETLKTFIIGLKIRNAIGWTSDVGQVGVKEVYSGEEEA